MVAGPGADLMRARRAGPPAGAPDDKRTFVVRLEAAHLGTIARCARGPFALELGAVPSGIEALQELPVGQDRPLDEVPRRRSEDGAPLGIVAVEQVRPAPALQRGRELPAESARVLEAEIDAMAAIGRMAVRCVPSDEDVPVPVRVGGREAQVPEA